MGQNMKYIHKEYRNRNFNFLLHFRKCILGIVSCAALSTIDGLTIKLQNKQVYYLLTKNPEVDKKVYFQMMVIPLTMGNCVLRNFEP